MKTVPILVQVVELKRGMNIEYKRSFLGILPDETVGREIVEIFNKTNTDKKISLGVEPFPVFETADDASIVKKAKEFAEKEMQLNKTVEKLVDFSDEELQAMNLSTDIMNRVQKMRQSLVGVA